MLLFQTSVFSTYQKWIDANLGRTGLTIIFIGSMLSLMKKIFAEYKEPLYGHMTGQILLKPLTPIVEKEVKMFLGFENVSTKWFDSVISHVHWVYCAYILLISGPPGMPEKMKSLADKQELVEEMLKSKELSSLNQLMTQINGVQRLKNEIQQALDRRSLKKHHIFQMII